MNVSICVETMGNRFSMEEKKKIKKWVDQLAVQKHTTWVQDG